MILTTEWESLDPLPFNLPCPFAETRHRSPSLCWFQLWRKPVLLFALLAIEAQASPQLAARSSRVDKPILNRAFSVISERILMSFQCAFSCHFSVEFCCVSVWISIAFQCEFLMRVKDPPSNLLQQRGAWNDLMTAFVVTMSECKDF